MYTELVRTHYRINNLAYHIIIMITLLSLQSLDEGYGAVLFLGIPIEVNENDQGKFCRVIDWDKDPIINSGAISKTLIL